MPLKKIIGNTSVEFIEKRKQELQVFLDVLSKHTNYANSVALKMFSSCMSSEEFEAYKARPKNAGGAISKDSIVIVMKTFKDFHIKDSLEMLYDLLKVKLKTKGEPAEIQSDINIEDIEKRINKYLPIMNLSLKSIENNIEFQKKLISSIRDISILLSDQDINNQELQNKSISYYNQNAVLINSNIDMDIKLLKEIREEKIKLEGIKIAFKERSLVKII